MSGISASRVTPVGGAGAPFPTPAASIFDLIFWNSGNSLVTGESHHINWQIASWISPGRFDVVSSREETRPGSDSCGLSFTLIAWENRKSGGVEKDVLLAYS